MSKQSPSKRTKPSVSQSVLIRLDRLATVLEEHTRVMKVSNRLTQEMLDVLIETQPEPDQAGDEPQTYLSGKRVS